MKGAWKIKGGRKRGLKAYMYADLFWGEDEKEKAMLLTLKHLCIYWNIQRLLASKSFRLGERVLNRKRYKLSFKKKMTFFYAHMLFLDWVKRNCTYLKTNTLAKTVKTLVAITLVQNAKYTICKELLYFYEHEFRKLHDRHRKTPRPLSKYQSLADENVVPIIHKTLAMLEDEEKRKTISELLLIPLP